MPWSGTSYADGRLFAGHEIESKRGDLRNSAFSSRFPGTGIKTGAEHLFYTFKMEYGILYEIAVGWASRRMP